MNVAQVTGWVRDDRGRAGLGPLANKGVAGEIARTSETVSQAAIAGVIGEAAKMPEQAAMRGGPLNTNKMEFMLIPMGKEGLHFSTMIQDLLAAHYPKLASSETHC